MWFKKPKKAHTNPDHIPNLQDAINSMSIPPRSQASLQPQEPTPTDPTVAQDQMQVDAITPYAPQDFMDPTKFVVCDHMQVDTYGVGPSFCIPSMTVSCSAAPEQMQENSGQLLPRRRKNWNSSTVSIGQDQAFNQVCTFLRNDEVGMVGIYGMGGVGKTTLMKKIRNEYLKPSNFRVILVVVSKSIDVDNIQKVIMKEMDLPFDQYAQPYQRAEQISKALDKKKIAFLFDDVWEFLDLENLEILNLFDLDMSICKIIFTTRSEKVCIQMQPDRAIKVECLGWDDAWALFEKSVGSKTLESDYRIESIARDIAKECKGLPLALTVIGRAMMCKYTPCEWEHALTTLQKSPSKVMDTEKHLFACLKLSYDNLPDCGEKNCFLYCCLFPEDWEMDEEELVEYWITEGFLAFNGSFLEVSKRGADIIGTLKATCLLERSSDMCLKMHDIIRDMGLWIVSELKWNFFVHGGTRLTKLEIVDRWREAHRIYVLKADRFPEQPLCLNLTTLIIGHYYPPIWISKNFFNFMGTIRVLKLWGVKFLDQTVEIGQLLELRYLSIHESNLVTMPRDIGNLSKLEVLDLQDSENSIEFPEKTIRHLVELRKLTMTPCSKALMVEVGYLNKIEFLRMEYGEGNDVDSEDDEKTDDIDSEDKGHLENFFIDDDSSLTINNDSIEELYEYQDDLISSLCQLSYSLRYLDMVRWPITRVVDLVSTFQRMDKLENLALREFALQDVLILTSLCLPSLKTLKIEDSEELKKIQVSQTALQNIWEMGITGCCSLECIIGLQHLKTLVKLTISRGKMEELIEVDEGEGSVCFPSLKVMQLRCFFHLKSICSDVVMFPSLKTLVLWECPELKKLPRGLMNENRTLKECEIDGLVTTRKWWSGLSWQDDGFKSFIETTLSPSSREHLLP